MRHKRVTVCNVPYSYEREREKDLYHSFVDEKERRERRHDSFARGKQFSECSLYGEWSLLSRRTTRTQTKKEKKKSFPFPLTLIRPRYYQREAIYHRRIDNGRSPKERTPTMGHKRNVRYKRVVPVLNASPSPFPPYSRSIDVS